MSDEEFKKYVSHVEEACGEEKDIIVMLKYDTKDEAINKILKRGKIVKSIANVVYELSYDDKVLRLYNTGNILMKKFKDRKEAEEVLKQLLI
ncbi:MAG: hypothetical protein N3F64_05665 [Nitrososphaeria archaeon]|nr:hypothetical protein [Nitrososphaeria archaeon]